MSQLSMFTDSEREEQEVIDLDESKGELPARIEIQQSHPFYDVWKKTKDCLSVLPVYFDSEINIVGIEATDIYTLNTTLAATIENQVVETLNKMRSVWDPENKYPDYSFIRRPQTFPDVLFAKHNLTSRGMYEVAFGIELKSWYVLSKEGEPSFRYKVTEEACSELDLIAVVPWHLTNVISGKTKIMPAYVESAKYAAQYRNFYWKNLRNTSESWGIYIPKGIAPYPKNQDKINDQPVSDKGGNFGRFARTGLMDEYIKQIDEEFISGIGIKYWRLFLKMFQEDEKVEIIESSLNKIEKSLGVIK